jgi:N6-adenosine-specific RNA methylase IME4
MASENANAGTGDPGARQACDRQPVEAANSQPCVQPTLPIDQIVVGERHRKELGDIDGLARWIDDIGGLMHPVVVRPDGRLIAGQRRILACRQLGWTEIPDRYLDLDDVERGEFAENASRKDFTPSELVDIGEAIERRERERARIRQAHGGPRSGNLPERTKGDARDKTATLLGVSGRTYEKAKAVVEAAHAEPERFGKLQADMDRTGRVNGVYRRLRIEKQAELIRAEPPPLPGNGPYRVAVIDLPWPYEKRDNDPSHRAARPYPTMAITEMRALPIASLMHTDSILWPWTTNHHMRETYELLDAWGFEVKTILTWAKDKMGTGDWLRGQTEHALMAVRGKPVVTLTNQTTLLHAPTPGHSVKPREFYDLVESLCPAPRYADLFSRYRHNERWDCHGDEAPVEALREAAA